ncbi:PilZ domain-containing protein [Thermodesulfobacteriota bacterium]
MTTDDKRAEHRIGSHNLLSYECLDEDGKVISQGMGRTLDVSEKGILLETHVPLDPLYMISLTISLEDLLFDIKGKVSHTEGQEKGKYESGIQFVGMDEAKTKILRQFTVIFKDEMKDS